MGGPTDGAIGQVICFDHGMQGPMLPLSNNSKATPHSVRTSEREEGAEPKYITSKHAPTSTCDECIHVSLLLCSNLLVFCGAAYHSTESEGRKERQADLGPRPTGPPDPIRSAQPAIPLWPTILGPKPGNISCSTAAEPPHMWTGLQIGLLGATENESYMSTSRQMQ